MSSAVGGRGSRMSPALIGAIAVLIVVITTFLAYNANRGLPWVPSQKLTVEVKNAANIVPGNEVRIGGTRVGIVEAEQPKRYPNGRVTALLLLKLDAGTDPLPINTTILIRARSLLGLKYVQLTPGDESRTFEWGSTVPLANATPDPVEIDQLLNTFDDPTRLGLQQTITAFGNTLIGKGSVIGQLLDDAGPLADDLAPVARILADDQEGLVPFLTALSRFTGELAAAGDATGGFFRNLDRTTGAIAAAGSSLDETLAEAPGALNSTADSLRATRGAIGPHIAFAKALQPGFENLADGAKDIAAASDAGIKGLPQTGRSARDLSSVLDQLDRVSNSSLVARGLDGLKQFSVSSQPVIESLSRAQRVCSYGSRLLRNLASVSSDGDSLGNWLRVAPVIPSFVPNSEAVPATSPSTGAQPPAGAFQRKSNAQLQQQVYTNYPFLHTNPSPVVGQGGRCEPGAEQRALPTPDAATGPATASPQQSVVIGAGGALKPAGTAPPRPAPPKGAFNRPASLDADDEDEE